MRTSRRGIPAICLILSLFLLQCSTGKKAGLATGGTLLNAEGIAVTLGSVAGQRPAVLIYLASECPISQKYCKTLREMAGEYPDIAFVGIFTKWEKVAEMNSFGNDYGLDFPLLLDREHQLLKKLNATVTPEAFLLDAQGTVLYHGAIDNWFYALGRNRPFPTENYLRDAIEAMRNGLEVPVAATEAIGCVIEE